MKKVVIGGFFAMIGTLWSMAAILFTANDLISAWSTPPGRFLTTVFTNGMIFPLLLALFFFALGIRILMVEYLKKEN